MSRTDAYAAYGLPARRTSAFGTLFKSIAAIAITGILCGSGIVLHLMNKVDRNAGDLIVLAGKAIEDLPGALKDAAPILADATKDRRAPDYVQSIELQARVLPVAGEDSFRTSSDSLRKRARSRRAVVEIRNNGSQVVSVLALRVVALDGAGDPLTDDTLYGATPLAIKDEWRGPLFPGKTRRIPVRCSADADKIELEIAELRVWDASGPPVPERTPQ